MPSATSASIASQSADPAAEVEAGRRLVEEEHRRPRDERGGEVEPAAHAARVRAHEPVAGVGEVEVGEQLARALARRRGGRGGRGGRPSRGSRSRSGSRRRPRTGRRGRCCSRTSRGVADDVEAGDARRAAVRARAASSGCGRPSSCRRRSGRAGRRRCRPRRAGRRRAAPRRRRSSLRAPASRLRLPPARPSRYPNLPSVMSERPDLVRDAEILTRVLLVHGETALFRPYGY